MFSNFISVNLKLPFKGACVLKFKKFRNFENFGNLKISEI